MMARAAGSALPLCSRRHRRQRLHHLLHAAPADDAGGDGSTASAPPGSLSAAAAAARTASDAATPSPAAQTFEILLLTTIACSAGDSASRLRPRWASRRALLVKRRRSAARARRARSSWFMTDGIGASCGTKLKPPVARGSPGQRRLRLEPRLVLLRRAKGQLGPRHGAADRAARRGAATAHDDDGSRPATSGSSSIGEPRASAGLSLTASP